MLSNPSNARMLLKTILPKAVIRCKIKSLALEYRFHAESPSFSTTVPRQKIGKPDKKLFTPGPLGCSRSVKEAMLRDLGSRDTEFIDTIKFIRNKLVEIAGVSKDLFTAIPIQGSGTFAVEAVLTTSTPRANGKVLILANGAYGKRMGKICDLAEIDYHMLSFPETTNVNFEAIQKHLQHNAYTTVAIVHCETSSGIVNPVKEIGQLVRQFLPNASYFVDAMSSFGAIPLNLDDSNVDFLVSSANKCLEGVPGFSYAISRTNKLLECKGNSRSLCLDLVDQYEGFSNGGQFRFTPPTHSMLAFKQALLEYDQEGGQEGRAKRYQANRDVLRKGMKALGFREMIDEVLQGYIITTYHYPNHPKFDFEEFYQRLNKLDQVIYPGKVTNADCFRIGNIGQLYPEDMQHLLFCVENVCRDMGLDIPVK